MANWTGLAGAAGLAAALEHIQDRRTKEAALQRELTAGQGEWTPMQGGGGGIGGFFDALLGHNRPGQIGFGGQRYQFQPYAQVTPEEATAWGMTYPEERKVPGLDIPSLNVAAPGAQPTFGAPAAALAKGAPEMAFTKADTNAYPFAPVTGPARTITEEKPLPGIVGMRLGPKEKMALFQDQLKARREEAKAKREMDMFKSLGGQGTEGFRVGGSTPGGTSIPDDILPEGVAPSKPPATGAQPAAAAIVPTGAAPAPVNKAAKGAPIGTPTPEINAAVAEATKLYPQVSAQRITSIIAQESNFDHTAVSPKKAKGLMQLMDGTAKDMGVNDPFDVRQNVRGGTRYYAELLTKYGGDERKALAAYNWGMGNLDGVGGDVSKAPASVQAYVGRVLADSGSPGTATAQAAPKTPATAQAQAPARGAEPALPTTDPATQTYVAQFKQGSEADALKTIVAAEDKANPKNPADQATLLAMKRALETVFPRGQAQVQAAGQPDISMQVAGPVAPAPKPTQPAVSPPPGVPAVQSPAPTAGGTGTGAGTALATTGKATTPPTTTETTTAQAPATTAATTDAPPVQKPFRLSMPGYQQIQTNNAKIAQNEGELRKLDAQQRQANYLAITTKSTAATAMATQIGGRISELSRANQSLRDQNEQTVQRETTEWRAQGVEAQKNWREAQEGLRKEQRTEQREIDSEGRAVKREIDKEGRSVKITIDSEGREVKREIEKEGRMVQITIDREGREVRHEIDKEGRQVAITIDREGREVKREIEKEGRKPSVEANVTTAVQDAEMTEPLRFTKQDLVSQGVAPDKPWKDYTTTEKAAVTREHVARQTEMNTIEKMNEFDRTALYAIAKRDGTPIGRATKEQLAEARQQGAIDQQENARGLEEAKAQGKMDGPIGESDAFKYINPKTGQPADPLETPRQARARGDILMDKPQQATIRNARNSLSYVNRLHVLYFGGKDEDGSITGTVGADFEGIYPAIEKVRKDNQHLSARAQNTLALRTGIIAGKPIAQWAQTADDFIAASLGQISRDLGGERGHFTDRDAERSRKFFANLGTRWWGESVFNPNFMTSSNVARNQLRLVTGVMSDRVRGALNLKPSDELPWDTFGRLMPTGQTKPAPPPQPPPPAQVPATARQTPPAAAPQVPPQSTPATAAPAPAPQQQAPAAPAPAQTPPQEAPPVQATPQEPVPAQPAPASAEEDPKALARYRQQFAGKSRVEIGELAATIWRGLPDGPERRAMETAAREALPPAPDQATAQTPASGKAPAQQAAPKKLDGPTAQRHMQQALGALFPGRTVQSLSPEEKQRLLQGARQVGAEAGYTP